MAEWVAAHCNGAVLWIFKELLLNCTSLDNSFEHRTEIINVKIQVHRSPVPLIAALLLRIDGRLRASLLFKQANIEITHAQYDHARVRFCFFCETKSIAIETNALFEAGYIYAY